MVNHFADQADTATIQTQANVPVISSSMFENANIDDIGEMQGLDLSLVVRTSSLTITPIIDGLVTYRTRSYRIRSIERHGDENAIILILQHTAQ